VGCVKPQTTKGAKMTEVRIRNIDKEIHADLKIIAIKKGLTLEELLNFVLEQFVIKFKTEREHD
jgi:plasmid stability protein